MPYIIALVLIALAALGSTFFKGNTSSKEMTTPTPIEQPLPKTETTSGQKPVTTPYKDGTYTDTVTYQTPSRSEYKIEVSLTLANSIVTDASVVYSQGAEKDPNPQRFEKAYKTEVIGKSLDNINLSRVGGASLTTGAFNKALTQIKTQAKS